jgi:hypothetical protein
MPRTVVPQQSSAPAAAAAGGGVGAAAGGGSSGDGLPEKLIKYVPAETLAFFVPVAAAIGTGKEGALIAAIIVAAVGSPLYLWVAGSKAAVAERPKLHFYILAEIALACWVLGTSGSVQSLVGVGETLGGVVLAGAAFLIPVTDEVLTKVGL